ncbi:hypothetical protein B0H14DRAFT_2675244 [Mycena olivaceomarginata]|nr:hypothetical protein B0H14DRAFT_2675244 [Mycena olivaceomarginata]
MPHQGRLDAETRQQRRRASRQRYEAKNLERRREAAKLRMQRLDAAEREHRCIADAKSRCVRISQEETRSRDPRTPVKNPASKTPHKAAKKLVLDAPLQKPKHRHLLDEDSASDDEEQQGGTELPLPQRFFEARAPHPARLRCKACGLDDCPGCACMCEVSVRWFDHPGGHFFPDCKSCGGIDCPGCACMCPKSVTFVEHGGHLM